MLTRVLARLSGVSLDTSAPPPRSALPVPATPGRRAVTDLYRFDPNHALLHLSPRDPWTITEACEGTQIFGAPGSGKTSGSGRTLARAFLRAGFGGLVLTDKPSERALWEGYAAETGRRDSLIVVRPSSRWRFNFLDDEFMREGEGAGHAANAVATFMNVLEAYDGRPGRDGDRFWHDNVRRLLRHAIELLVAGRTPVTLDCIMSLVQGAPESRREAADPAWQAGSACWQQLVAAGMPERSRAFWLQEFAQLPPKTRASIVSTFTGMADPFIDGPLHELFCTTTTFTPDLSRKGAVIVLDLPTSEWGEVGRSAQILFKYLWQRAIMRRSGVAHGERPVFLWVDEAQTFLTRHDMTFQQKARESVACSVFLTQNIANYYATLEAQRGRAQADALLGNFATKIFHANGDHATNEFAANAFGRVLHLRQNWGSSDNRSVSLGEGGGWSVSSNGQQTTSGVSFNSNSSVSRSLGTSHGVRQEKDFQLDPYWFTRLKTGGPGNGFEVQAFVFKAGRTWQRTGSNYIDVTFSQRAS